MPSIAIGVVAYEEPARVRATLESVAAKTPRPHELLLLGDGPDEETLALLSLWPGRLLHVPEPMGMAFCLNRLFAESDADIVVLLEAGSICGDGWLDRMVAALLASPRNGLAGPSTNLCWNEQNAFPGEGDPDEHSRAALARFGDKVQTLEPLYSLADFCYVVRRAVFHEIGPADEDYGLGPCWEMDYNIRAARAGWRGIWTCGAYVGRMPFAPRRRRDESALFERNRQRYQSKFCARQLRGAGAAFRRHCNGDRCPNFAPRETNCLQVLPQRDLITCLMPTYNRPDWVKRSIRCFLSQDHERRELLILDDSSTPIADIPSDPRIRYERLAERMRIGAKRNLGCQMARGEWIAHWDDDDWYPRDRLTRQLEAVRSREFDVCGSTRLYYIDRSAKRAFRYEYEDGGRAWVAGQTLFYRKSYWLKHPFRDIQVGEDAHFVWGAQPSRVLDLADPTICVASLHDFNTGRKDVTNSYWKPAEYSEIEAMTADFVSCPAECPLISCIMPTANRRAFLSLALRLLLTQRDVPCELVVVDDGADTVEDAIADYPGARYIRLPRRTSIGEKRNIACQHARGEIVAHWDDDDWYGPDRLKLQITPLIRGEAEITGLVNTHVLTLPEGDFWTPTEDLHQRMFVGNVSGGTLVFWKRLWEGGIRYPSANLAEDAGLVRSAMERGHRLARVSGNGLYVYVRHQRNSWKFQPGRFLDPSGWRRVDGPREFPPEILAEYRAAALACRR